MTFPMMMPIRIPMAGLTSPYHRKKQHKSNRRQALHHLALQEPEDFHLVEVLEAFECAPEQAQPPGVLFSAIPAIKSR